MCVLVSIVSNVWALNLLQFVRSHVVPILPKRDIADLLVVVPVLVEEPTNDIVVSLRASLQSAELIARR
jgi:hypothetical protein